MILCEKQREVFFCVYLANYLYRPTHKIDQIHKPPSEPRKNTIQTPNAKRTNRTNQQPTDRTIRPIDTISYNCMLGECLIATYFCVLTLFSHLQKPRVTTPTKYESLQKHIYPKNANHKS